MEQIDRNQWIAEAEPEDLDRFDRSLTDREREEYDYHWCFAARDGQLAPEDRWKTWLILAGRGFGKTRTGAEWVSAVAEDDPRARIALVAASLGEARSVMVEGESGILARCQPARSPTFESSLRRLVWPNGAQAMLYSAAEPDSPARTATQSCLVRRTGQMGERRRQGRRSLGQPAARTAAR